MRSPRPIGPSWGPLLDRILGMEKQIRDLQKASGTQILGTVAYLKSLVTRGAAAGSFLTGATPGDQTWRWYDQPTTPISVTLDAPTGRVLITVGCGEANLLPGDLAASAAMSFEITTPSGWTYPVATRTTRMYSSDLPAGNRAGSSLMLNVPASVNTWEPITVTAKMGIWSASTTSLAEAIFNSPYLIVQVVDPLSI